MPWFVLDILDIDWINRAIVEPPKNFTSRPLIVSKSSLEPHGNRSLLKGIQDYIKEPLRNGFI